jgi:hypothetical protein
MKHVFSVCYAVALQEFCQNGKELCHFDKIAGEKNEISLPGGSFRMINTGTDFAGLSQVMVL